MYLVNDDLSIYVTRGDILCFTVDAVDEDTGNLYEFQPGDIVRMKVYGKKDAENVVMQKDFPVATKTESVGIFLTESDTKIGDVISKPTDYWYEIELNPFTNPQTIIGYDEDGAKIFKLFPEGRDLVEDEPVAPEEIPVVDTDLSLLSSRPVENKAVSRAITLLKNDLLAADTRLTAKVKANEKSGNELTERFNNLISFKNASVSQNLEYLETVSEEMKAKVDGHIDSDGVFASVSVNLREANLIAGGTEFEAFIIPNKCCPSTVGLIHEEDGLEYHINHDGTKYYMVIRGQSGVTTAPSTAGTVTFTYGLYNYEVKDIRVGADGVTYESAGVAVREQAKRLSGALEKTSLLPKVVWTDGSYVAANGYIWELEPYSYATIPVIPKTKISITTHIADNAGIVFVNEDGATISCIKSENASTEFESLYSAVLEVPEDAASMLASCIKKNKGEFCAVYSNIIETTLEEAKAHTDEVVSTYTGKEISLFNHICCVGDSLTKGTFNHNENGHVAFTEIEKYSYPAYIKKIYGVNTSNYGLGGLTSVEWVERCKNGRFGNDEHHGLGGFDCAIIQQGVNDALQGVSVADTKGALQEIVDMLKDANDGIKIFVATITPAYADGTTIYNGVNDAIAEVVSANADCYLVDMTNLSACHKGSVYENGHLTALGYYQVAKEYGENIGRIIRENLADFMWVQFAGTTYKQN